MSLSQLYCQSNNLTGFLINTAILFSGNISALNFTVTAIDDSRVTVNITVPLTSIHKRGKQLSIKDVLKNDLKYKIRYWKSGSTGKVQYLDIAAQPLS